MHAPPPPQRQPPCQVPPYVKGIPLGTVHLNYPAIGGLVSRMGNVDYAPARVGFERHGGRMIPKLEGIVVCKAR